MNKKHTQGAASNFDRRFLEANLKGTDYKGSKVTSVSNKYIHTENESFERKGRTISFTVKEGTENLISPDTSGDTEGDKL